MGRKRWSCKRSRNKWKHSYSSDPNPVSLMTPLMTDFLFSLGHEHSYNSAYNFNDSENQPLGTEAEWTVSF